MTDDLVVSNSFYRFKEGQVVGTRCFLPGCKSIVDIKRQTCAYGGTMWTNIVRKDFFIENNLFYPEKLIYEDNANGPLIYLKANSISVIEHPFYYYCLNPSSTVQKKNHPNYFDRTVTSQIFYKNAQSDNQYKYYKEEIDFNFYRVFLYNTVRGSISTFSSLPSQRLKDVITTYKREWGGVILGNKYYKSVKRNAVDSLVNYVCFHPQLFWIISILHWGYWIPRRVKRIFI